MAKEQAAPAELNQIAEQVGAFIRYWGFKKVHGQIWAHLFLSAEPLDAAALMARLGISKALASMSLSDLLEYRVILMEEKSKRGTQLYRANPDVMEAILEVLRGRERRMLAALQSSQRNLEKAAGRDSGGALNSSQVQKLGELIGAAGEMLDAFLSFRQIDLALFEKFGAPAETAATAAKSAEF